MDDSVLQVERIWWIFLAATLVALILSAAFVTSMIIQQRRYLATTRAFGGRLLLAQEEERTRVARELHDDLIQRIGLLGQDLQELENRSVEGGSVRLAGFREELHDLADEIRRIAHRMHPSSIEYLGLPAALVQLGAEFGIQGLNVTVNSSLDPSDAPSEVRTALYRIAQEALRNVLRHASASHAAVRLAREADGIILEISDDGCGFDPGAPAAMGGLGLTSLRERARLLEGRLTIRSRDGEGTTVTAWVPLG
ncbi:MAG TPA: sensor histidine kinase [Gemmatimonadales bacterium]|nr:sensor histidine kinase [Gemmatimonadales bacterium]